MHVFVTGATGWVGSAVVDDLLAAGHTVTGLARSADKAAAQALSQRGVHVASVRLPPSVHGLGDRGFIAILVRLARQTGIAAWHGDGQNCWSGVHRRDAARVYRLALEQGVTERVYHAVTDEAVPFRTIAETLGRQLGLPAGERDREHFGWFANMTAGNMAVSSARTRALLDWSATRPGLLSELNTPAYYTHL